jgi:hypothetical protein
VYPYGSTDAVKGAAVSKQGRLLGVPTDGRLLCNPISSIPAVRQLPAGKSALAKRSSPGSPRGGGRWKNSQLCARKERARREGEGAASQLCARKERARREGEGAASQLCARKERARREGEGAASQVYEEAHRGGDVRARQHAGGGSTVEETCARDSA